MRNLESIGMQLAENGRIPDKLVRYKIRQLCQERLDSLIGQDDSRLWVEHNGEKPIAVETDKANEQHYKLPAEFFRLVLGDNLKYSSAYWDGDITNLNEAEERALQLTCEHAGIKDGMTILELGCGWGSLTCYVLRHYPKCRVVAVSNSSLQREFITKRLVDNGWKHRCDVKTSDINDFQSTETFDRVVSVEMFEHVSNHQALFDRIGKWLSPTGKIFVHVFCHEKYSYRFEVEGSADWMARHFFTGGVMPSEMTLPNAATGFELEQSWIWNGIHYQRTSDQWLKNMDDEKLNIMRIFREHYGNKAKVWWGRWRMFFLAVSELFKFDQGKQWRIAHYLFQPSPKSASVE